MCQGSDRLTTNFSFSEAELWYESDGSGQSRLPRHLLLHRGEAQQRQLRRQEPGKDKEASEPGRAHPDHRLWASDWSVSWESLGEPLTHTTKATMNEALTKPLEWTTRDKSVRIFVRLYTDRTKMCGEGLQDTKLRTVRPLRHVFVSIPSCKLVSLVSVGLILGVWQKSR